MKKRLYVGPYGRLLRLARWGMLVAVIALAAGLTSCSTRKNSAASRNYQAFITRYNVYFNGDEHLKETLKEMERSYEDDYTSLLLMHPAEAYAVEGAPQPTGSFTRSIEKAQKAIQLHSIKKPPRRRPGHSRDVEYQKWMKRDEYNPFLHNAWMMMGRSQYFGGDFLGAASTFYYVAKHFSWLPATVLEAKLWQARCYCALDWLFEAETILTRVRTDRLESSKLRELYYFTYADFYIRSHDYPAAIPMLREAVGYAKGTQKVRLNFLLGQLCAAVGDKQGAYEAYKRAGSGNAASYRTKFNARIKQSEVFGGSDIKPEVKALRRMARYGRNSEYLDQIYYAIGNLYLSRRDTANAIANYRLAAEKSTRNGMEKGVAQLALGRLYYDRHRYDLAQPCYADAVTSLPPSYPDYEGIKRRSDVLDELALYSRNVTLNDSLLRLAAMPEAERLKVVDRIIADLKKREKEEAERMRREEYLAEQQAVSMVIQPTSAATPNNFTLNTDKSWYFYNPATRNAGRTEFQRRWGARKLEDDWRRHNKNRFTFGDFEDSRTDEAGDDNENEAQGESVDTSTDEDAGRAQALASDPHEREYYLRQIPMTDVERTTANDVIQEGMYNCGLILKDDLDDAEAAEAEWAKLLSRYPHNVYRLDVYYNEYLMNMRLNRYAEAEKWGQKILSEFPDSKYGVAMRDERYIDNLREMDSRQEALYEKAYADYLADRNAPVHEARREVERDYPMSPLMPKFMFLDALAYVTEDKPEEFRTALRELLERYPDTEFTPMASSYLQGMAHGRKLNSGGTNVRGMVWETRLTTDSVGADGETVPVEFSLAPDEPHYMVLLFSTEDVAPNQLLYEVARHNFSTYVVRDFDLEMMNFGQLGLLVVKGFENEDEVNHYRSQLEADGSVTQMGDVRPVPISKRNFEQLLLNGASFDDYFRFLSGETLRRTHESVLPSTEYPSAEEMFGE